MLGRPLPDRSSWIVRVETFGEEGAIVAVEGDLDRVAAPQLEAAVTAMIGYGHRQLVIDLTGSSSVDSGAVQTLLVALMPLRDEPAAAVVLVGCTPGVSRSLAVGGMAESFTAFDTRQAAIAYLDQPDGMPRDAWRTHDLRPD